MKNIMLHGQLGALFGASWHLDVLTPAEAVRAIEANRPGFTRHLVESEEEGIGYQILLDDQDIDPQALNHPFGRETFHIVPCLCGAGNGGAVAKVVVGAVLAIASAGIGIAAMGAASGLGAGAVLTEGGIGMALSQTAVLGMSYGTIALLGTSMAFAGISQLLAKTPDLAATQEKDGSFAFSGYVNTAAQGGPVPVGYGELIIGSTVISSGIKVKEEASA